MCQVMKKSFSHNEVKTTLLEGHACKIAYPNIDLGSNVQSLGRFLNYLPGAIRNIYSDHMCCAKCYHQQGIKPIAGT